MTAVALAAPEPEPGVGFFASPVWGFRAWLVDADCYLVSPYQRAAWPVGEELESRHGTSWTRAHSRTGFGCEPGHPCRQCGIYAFDAPGKLQRYRGSRGGNRPLNEVRGIVAGWGQVTLCRDGWRAGRAYPLGLLDWEVSPAVLIDLGYGDSIRQHYRMHRAAHHYGIPVLETADELVAYAQAQGCVPPWEMVA